MADSILIGYPGDVKTPSPVGTVYPFFNVGGGGYSKLGGNIEVSDQYGIVYTIPIPSSGVINDNFTISLGLNIITYNIEATTYDGEYKIKKTEKFSVYGVPNKYPLKPWTVQDCIDRIFELEQPLLVEDNPLGAIYVRPPRFKFAYPAPKYEVETVKVAVRPSAVAPYDFALTIQSPLKRKLTFAKIKDIGELTSANVTINPNNTCTITGVAPYSALGRFYVTVKLIAEYAGDNSNAQEFSRIAPEFTHTRQTVREALQTIGGYIHAEPRLYFNEITEEFDTFSFDFYGGQEYAEYYDVNHKALRRLSDYNYEDKRGGWGIEQACNALDGYMDNLINRVRFNFGTVGQPFEGGAQTPRTDVSNVRLEDENMFLPTSYPIESIQAVYWINPNEEDELTGGYKKYDISAYIYESKVYNSQLSSYDGNYPSSKAYALYYTQGEKGIHGFWFKEANAISSSLENYSVVNIIKEASGVKISGIEEQQNLQFEVVYTPIYSARIAHTKQYLGDFLQYPATLNYSQGYNSVDTQAYGENIKGAVERIGTPDETYTFACRNVDTIPKAGQLWDDDYYISSVFVEVLQDRFKVSCGLSKNFNRKSQYIGIASYKRIYEVSERMVQQRESLYKDYIVISRQKEDFTPPNQRDCLITDRILAYVANAFIQRNSVVFNKKAYPTTKVSYAIIQGARKSFQSLNKICLPVIASAQGNVIEFSWEFQDNYSAGLQTMDVETGRFSVDVQYADYYGRMYYEKFSLHCTPTENKVLNQLAVKLPYWNYPLNNFTSPVYGTGTYYLLRRKDSREALKENVVFQYVTTEKDFIIGSALARNNPLVSGVNTNAKVRFYALKNPINKFSKTLDLSEENVVASIKVERSNFSLNTENLLLSLSVGKIETTETGIFAKAWAYAVPIYEGEPYTVEDESGNIETFTPQYGGELLLGCNENMQQGEIYGNIQIYGVHNIYEFLKTLNKE